MVKSNVAIVGPRVRFSAGAIRRILSFCLSLQACNVSVLGFRRSLWFTHGKQYARLIFKYVLCPIFTNWNCHEHDVTWCVNYYVVCWIISFSSSQSFTFCCQLTHRIIIAYKAGPTSWMFFCRCETCPVVWVASCDTSGRQKPVHMQLTINNSVEVRYYQHNNTCCRWSIWASVSLCLCVSCQQIECYPY